MADASNVRIVVSDERGRPLLVDTLRYLAQRARVNHGLIHEVLPFTYTDPYDPADPEAPRPLRRARLMLMDDGPVR